MKNKPKILLYDIETSPIMAHVWSLWNNNVALNQIESDWFVLSWAAKWLGSNEVMYKDQRNKRVMENDRVILKYIWRLLDQADVVITQNGKKFDQKRLNARFIIHGMQPPSSYKHIDTLEIAKQTFGFTSNKLKYLTENLCTEHRKLSHSKYPGHELWVGCLRNELEAWEEMEEYNRVDVLALEELYLKLQPWDSTINFNWYTGEKADYVCGCGSKKFHKNGFVYLTAGKYQRYKCVNCGHQTRGTKNLFSKDKRKKLRRKIKL
jgi:DNA polymerase elongation subunit (family B)